MITTLVIVVIGFIAFYAFANYAHEKNLLSLSEGRETDSICTFARSFDYRQVDTKAIRAVYEALQPYLIISSKQFPIRRDDRLLEDYGIDLEELEFIFIDEIGPATNRQLEDTENNPYYDKVSSVGDLVLFTHHQLVTTQ